MKHYTFALFAFAFLCTASLVSCEKNFSVKQEYHLQNASEIINAFNAQRPESQWAKRMEGKVSINVSDTIIHIKNDIADDPTLTIYFLQIENPVQGFDSMELGLSEVLFLDKHLIVNSLVRNETVLFSLEGAPLPEYLNDIFFTHQFSGYGIGQHSISRNFK